MKNKRITSPKGVLGDARVVRVKTERSGTGALKTLVVLCVIASQLALIVLFHVRLALAFQWYMVFSFVMSVLTCLYVLSSPKNSLSKAVWIIFLLLGFTFAYVIYLLSDERFFFRKAKRRYKAVFERAASSAPAGATLDGVSGAVAGDARYLKAVGFPAYKNSSAEYFPSAARFFDSALERLASAKKFIFIEYYIISDGVLLRRFKDVLAERAASGVDVRIIYDDMGSSRTLSERSKSELRALGVQLLPFGRLVPFFSVALNYRDHRKMIVVDGETAYTGGCNFADEYINEKRMYGYWKDAGLRVDGEAVSSFTLFFLRQWEFLSSRSEELAPYLGCAAPTPSEALTVPYIDGLDVAANVGKNVYENLIASAHERIYVMSPYFICDDSLTALLANKARSGVDVRIILPGVPDKPFVYGVSRNNAEKLIPFGVRLYCMKNTFVHSKLVLTENAVVVGSVNMDLRSFYQQFECAVLTNDGGVMSAVLEDFNDSFPECEEVTEENQKRKNVFHRIFAGILQIFAPLM